MRDARDYKSQEPYVPPRAPVGRIGLALIILQFLIGGYVGGYILATVILIGPLTKNFGDLGAYVIGCIVNIMGLSLLLLGPTVWASVAGLLITVVGASIWNTVLSSVLTKISPEDKVGFMLGVSSGASMIGRVFGPLVVGGVFLGISYELPFGVSLALVSIVLANAVRILISQKRAAGA